MEPVWVYDTTLRDGTQGEKINFSARDKINIARRLDEIGVHYIEGGWPGSNPRDMHFFDLAKGQSFKQARISAFGATRKPGISVADDPNIQALLAAETPTVTIFGKTWNLHVTEIMHNTPQENLDMIFESVRYLKDAGREVIYDAEHFFDGFKDNPGYAVKTLKAAAQGGADFLVLCDTNGGTLPFDLEEMVQAVNTELEPGCAPPLGIHTHNDAGVAVANTLIAVKAGVAMVQGTINGYGERCGNADLVTIIPNLSLKMQRTTIPAENLGQLKRLSRYVSETANMIPVSSRPFVGISAFAHKGGIHVNAIMKNPRAYEHLDPTLVGNRRRVLISDMSGRSNVEYKAREMGIKLDANGAESRQIVTAIKELEEQGFQFDVADGSFKVLVEKLTDQFKPYFELMSFRVVVEKDQDLPCAAHATIKIKVDEQEEITAAEGDGPVSALDNALRKALDKFYPGLDYMHLVDFKVRVIDGRSGTAAKVRVFIESRDQEEVWSTIGVSEDIIEASWQALADSFHYKLAKPANSDSENHKE
jgi:2-isopropylmalate synthase